MGVNSKCGIQSKRRCESHESCVCIVGFPACGCQKKSAVYETECRHAAVQRGKQDQNHLYKYMLKVIFAFYVHGLFHMHIYVKQLHTVWTETDKNKHLSQHHFQFKLSNNAVTLTQWNWKQSVKAHWGLLCTILHSDCKLKQFTCIIFYLPAFPQPTFTLTGPVPLRKQLSICPYLAILF